jgi:FkbM family methyltransferase
MDLIPFLAQNDKMSIDVGADRGYYCAKMLQYSPRVVCFEPRLKEASGLSEMARLLHLPLTVETVALSDHSGTATLRMLTEDPGRSTIEGANPLTDHDGSPQSRFEVVTRPLDDYGFEDAGFIKIDVEGHEMAVLRGAKKTIDSCRCSLLVEAEDRHAAGATANLFRWMQERQYSGFFLVGRELVPTDKFVLGEHQVESNVGGWRSGWQKTGIYVNNFIFLPSENLGQFLCACGTAGFRPRQ